MVQTIGNPLSWGSGLLGHAGRDLGDAVGAMGGSEDTHPVARRIDKDDIRLALRAGYEDFKAMRTDVLTVILLYPIVGAILATFALHANLVHLVFPLASGFLLLGPMAAVGLYEMSRRREAGEPVGMGTFFSVLRPQIIGPVAALGIILMVFFIAWMIAAQAIFASTIGSASALTVNEFLSATLSTSAGHTMIVVGIGVGLVFALIVLSLFIVAFPMMIDRKASVAEAMTTSLALTRKNPVTVFTWGVIVAVLMVLGMVPLLIGLAVVLPILGHASWHFYRRAVAYEANK